MAIRKHIERVIFGASFVVGGFLLAAPVSANDFSCQTDFGGKIVGKDVDGDVYYRYDCVIRRSTVNGNVIGDGADLRVIRSEVNGNIEVDGGDVYVRKMSFVNGNIKGDDNVYCSRSEVNGNIKDGNKCAGVTDSCEVNGNICDY